MSSLAVVAVKCTARVIGKRMLHKVTMKFIQILVGVLLMAIALALGAGIV